jgi:stage II sporulation protein D
MRPVSGAPRRWRPLTLAVAFVIIAGSSNHLPRGLSAQAAVSDADLDRASDGRVVNLGTPSTGRVVAVPLETYVARVIAGEAEPSAPEAAREAIAIAIRTFAIVNARRHAKDGFDLCDTTHCQVPRASTPATRLAALATAGRILTYHGAPAEVFYSANCGGRSESASEVWPGVNLPYLVPVDDDVHADDVPWTLDLSLAQIHAALRAAGFEGARLEGIEIDERNESGRVRRLRLDGLTPATISGTALRAAIGAGTLRSTAFSLVRSDDLVRFTGRGYGHGVGMCVVGAARRARRGETAEAILAAYYPGLRVVALDGAGVVTTDRP